LHGIPDKECVVKEGICCSEGSRRIHEPAGSLQL
jgi:hypothetical protein